MTAQRRRFLQLIGVAGIGALAGCSSGEQNTEADDSETNGTETKTNGTASASFTEFLIDFRQIVTRCGVYIPSTDLCLNPVRRVL